MKVFVVFALVLITSYPTIGQAGAGPRQQLTQYVADLQKSPNDQALREKIIKLALTLDPRPATPEETKRFLARGLAAAEEAKEAKDFKDAAAEFEKASLAAPWLGEPYRDLGIVQDKAGDYAAATRNLKLYLLSEPDAAEADKGKELIYKIEFKQEKAAKESEARAEEQRRQERAAEAARAAVDERINAKRRVNQKFVGHWTLINIHGVRFPDWLILVLNGDGDLRRADKYDGTLYPVDGPGSCKIQVDGSRIVLTDKSIGNQISEWRSLQISDDGMRMTGSEYNDDYPNGIQEAFVKQ